MIHFQKYQALGNDYLIVEPHSLNSPLSIPQIRWLCDRHFGIGSDGVLLGPLPSEKADFGLRIYNPDGSEAEKSGNGLRIFARYLWDRDLTPIVSDHESLSEELNPVGNHNSERKTHFTIETIGGIVEAQVLPESNDVIIHMGRVSFNSQDIPVLGAERQVLKETTQVLGRDLVYCAATIGNPHCIILGETVSPQNARLLGPVLETQPLFPNRTNVQFMEIVDTHIIRIEIWERGAGYTLASGSSSCAAAACAVRLGLCQSPVTVIMPGGRVWVEISPDFQVTLRGEAQKIFAGTISSLPG